MSKVQCNKSKCSDSRSIEYYIVLFNLLDSDSEVLAGKMETSFKVVVLCEDGYEEEQLSRGGYNIYKAFGMKNKKKICHNCGVCGKQFEYFRDMKLHEQIHFGLKRFTCALCSKVFGRGYHLSRHLCNVHKLELSEVKDLMAQDEEPSPDKRPKTNPKLKKRKKKVKKQYECDECSEHFSSMSHLQEHNSAAHDNSKDPFDVPKSRYQCSDCNDVFFTAGEIKSHVSFCKKRRVYKCRECGGEFSNKTSMMEHKRLHLDWDVHSVQADLKAKDAKLNAQVNGGLKPNKMKCDLCKKGFKESSAFEKHLKMHAGKKIFRCSICKKSFKLEKELEKHRKIVHKKKGLKKEIGEVSGKKGSSKFRIKHNSGHTMKRKVGYVECDVCGRWLADNKGSLLKHKLMHSDVKRHKCSICPKRFARSDHLSQHMWHVHKTKRQYPCPDCEMKFEVFNDLLWHRKEHRAQKRKRGAKSKKKTRGESGEEAPKRKKTEEERSDDVGEAEEVSDDTYKCGSCTLEFLKLEDLTEHKKSHSESKEKSQT